MTTAVPLREYATREWVRSLVRTEISEIAQTIREENTEQINRTVSGFAARMFKQLPQAIAQAIVEANPSINFDAEQLTSTLESVLASKAPKR